MTEDATTNDFQEIIEDISFLSGNEQTIDKEAVNELRFILNDVKTDYPGVNEENISEIQTIINETRILEFQPKKRKLIFKNGQSPGDLVMLTAAVRDLHLSNPNKFLTDVRTPAMALWENNPYITHIDDNDPEAEIIQAEYPLIHESNEGAHHFIHGFSQFLEKKLNVRIHVTKLKGDIHLSDAEKSWYSQIYEILEKDVPYWIIDAGGKSDYTAKIWSRKRFQEVVDKLPNVIFVQIGSKEHLHPALTGKNLLNLIGLTDMRQLIRLIYHSYGVITPVSLPMHLSAAIEPHPRFKRKSRPCIVLAGGREPSIWEAYTNHQFLHSCGSLRCCDNGGCWKSRVLPLDDKEHHNNSLCVDPVKVEAGQVIPKCLSLITSDDVVRHIKTAMSQNK